MTVFISGGCKNGKSSIAEDICVKLSCGGPLYYIATMQAFDDEDRARIARHIKSRDGKGFDTIEQPKNISELCSKCDAENSTFILDSLTALMINELFPSLDSVGEESYGMSMDKAAPKRLISELEIFLRKAKNVVIVSDYIYQELENYSEYTIDYLKALSSVDKALAAMCDVVMEVSFGNKIVYKGAELL